MIRKVFLGTLYCILITSFLTAQNGITFQNDAWEEILTKAEKENKLIFVDAYTTWCAPCKKMVKEVFPEAEVGHLYNAKFVNVQIDMEKGEGPDLAQKYNIFVYPTLLFLNPDGSLVHRSAGFKDAADFIDLGKTALDPSKRISSLKKRFAKGDRQPEFLKAYTAVLFTAYDGSHAPIAKAYMNTQDNWASKDNMEFIFTYVNETNSPIFDHLVNNRDLYFDQFGQQNVTAKIQTLIYNSLNDSKEKSSLEQIDELYLKIYPERAEQLSAAFRITYYRQAGDRENFAKSAIHYYKKFSSTDPAELNDIAWTFYTVIDNKKQLKQAVKWAKKSIKLDSNFYNHDTLAALYYKMGKKKKGIKTAKTAINMAMDQGEDYSETQKLLEEIYKL